MKKILPMAQYEWVIFFKSMCIFYLILSAIITLIFFISYMTTGSFDIHMNALEINSMVYLGIMGAVEFKENFKMMIQNGYPRRYIYITSISLFVFFAALMSIIDVVIGMLLCRFADYQMMFTMLYGSNQSLFSNILWVFALHFFVCVLVYMVTLFAHKIGKKAFMLASVFFVLFLVLFIPFTLQYLLSATLVENLITFLLQLIGFTSSGINLFYPISFFLIVSLIACTLAFLILRKTELKA